MKNPKLILAYLSMPFFGVFGISLILSLMGYKQEDADFGILMSVISGLTFFPIIVLGIISFIIDIGGRRKALPKLTWILLIFPFFTLLPLFLPIEFEKYQLESGFLIVCAVSIALIIVEIRKNKQENLAI